MGRGLELHGIKHDRLWLPFLGGTVGDAVSLGVSMIGTCGSGPG